MARIALLAIIVLLIAWGILWVWNWVKRNKVEFKINRPPTPRELYFLGAIFQVIRRLIRVFFRF